MCVLIFFWLFEWKFTFLDFNSLPAHHWRMFHFDVHRIMTEKREVISVWCCLIRTSLKLSWSWFLCSIRGLIFKRVLWWNIATKKSHFQHILLHMDVFCSLSHWARSHLVSLVFSMFCDEGNVTSVSDSSDIENSYSGLWQSFICLNFTAQTKSSIRTSIPNICYKNVILCSKPDLKYKNCFCLECYSWLIVILVFFGIKWGCLGMLQQPPKYLLMCFLFFLRYLGLNK